MTVQAVTRRRPRAVSAIAANGILAVIAVAYLATVAAIAPRIVDALGWDTDAAAPFVLAERLRGSGPVFISHYAEWTSLWWLLATRDLPGHVQLWQATGAVFALASVALAGWATARIAGISAGLTAATAAIVVGPVAVRSLLTVNFHVSTPFSAAVLAALLAVLDGRNAWLLVVPVGAVTGVNAASDPLLWIVGVVPFAGAAAAVAGSARSREIAAKAAVTVACAVAVAGTTDVVMRALGYHVASAGVGVARLRDVPGHVLLLGRLIAFLGGANYAVPGTYPPEPLRAIVALLALLAVGAPVLAAVRGFANRSAPLARGYACYWCLSAVLLGVAFVVTTNAAALGSGSVNYLLTLALGAGCGIALLTTGWRSRAVVAVAIAVVATVNAADVVAGHAGTPPGAIGRYQQQVVQFLTERRLTHGYAGYWDAQNLTWQSRMRLFVAPVAECGKQRPAALCAMRYSTIASWYTPKPGRSFLIVDPTTGYVIDPPAVARDALATRRFGPIRVYLFAGDLAQRIRAPAG